MAREASVNFGFICASFEILRKCQFKHACLKTTFSHQGFGGLPKRKILGKVRLNMQVSTDLFAPRIFDAFFEAPNPRKGPFKHARRSF